MRRHLTVVWHWAPIVVIGGIGAWYLAVVVAAIPLLLIHGDYGRTILDALLRGLFYAFVAYLIWENGRLRKTQQVHQIAASKAFLAGFEAAQRRKGDAA